MRVHRDVFGYCYPVLPQTSSMCEMTEDNTRSARFPVNVRGAWIHVKVVFYVNKAVESSLRLTRRETVFDDRLSVMFLSRGMNSFEHLCREAGRSEDERKRLYKRVMKTCLMCAMTEFVLTFYRGGGIPSHHVFYPYAYRAGGIDFGMMYTHMGTDDKRTCARWVADWCTLVPGNVVKSVARRFNVYNERQLLTDTDSESEVEFLARE